MGSAMGSGAMGSGAMGSRRGERSAATCPAALVRVGMLSREPEPNIASGAVCCGCTRRLDMYTDDLRRLGDGPSVFPLGPSGLRSPRTPRATRALGGHRGQTCVANHSSVRWIQIMKPVRSHSADPGECDRTGFMI